MSQETPETSATGQDSIDVAHLAGLARLALSDKASVEVAADLQSIMAMIDAMRAVDTDGVQPLSHPLDAAVRLRSDVVTESPDPQHFQRHAPATADQYYLVPRVVE